LKRLRQKRSFWLQAQLAKEKLLFMASGIFPPKRSVGGKMISLYSAAPAAELCEAF